jgi:hypothetical protein
MIDRLSNGDITKHDEVYKRNYIECLNLLSYWYERDKFFEAPRIYFSDNLS